MNAASLAEGGADVRGMFDRVASRYDAANRVMSMGIDVVWRKRAIARLLEGLGDAPRLLDLGAGTLDGALEISRRAPRARVAAADFATQMLRAGRKKLRDGGELAIAPHAADGHHLPYRDGAFDGVFSAFCVRNLRELPAGLRELRRVLRPGGRAVILEFLRPARTRLFVDRIWNGRVLPLVGWAVTGDRAAYQYLPQSIAHFRSVAEMEALLTEVGFQQVEARPLFPSGVATMLVMQ